ncbi:MAG: FtsX-like permease family protein [Dehalococcoidales bacterium]|nr:FtsX-like permease family protein [Dehalococcoidales bacterium]
MKTLRKKLIRDLCSDKWLFLAVTVVIFLGAALFCSSLIAFQNMRSSYDYSYEKLGFADFTLEVKSAPPDAKEKLKRLPGVKSVTGRTYIDIGISLPQKDGQKMIATLISVPQDSHPEVNDLKIESGNYLSPGNDYQVLLEKSFAEYHGLKPGDGILLYGISGEKEFTTAGIATSPEYIFPAKSKNEFFVSPDTWGVIFVPDTVVSELSGDNGDNQFCVLVDEGADVSSVIGLFKETLEPYSVIEVVTRDEQPSNAGLEMDLQEFGEMAEIFPVLFLLVGAITTFILLSRIIQRQRSQLGLMRAIGYSRRQVLWHYLGFALVIGVTGSITGVIAGYFLAGSITDLYIEMLGLPYKLAGFHWMAMEEGVIIGILPCLIAGIFPALAASRLQPAEAMRTPSPAGGRKLLIERVIPYFGRLSLLWKIPLRNIFRNRRRSLSTVLGVAFGAILMMASAGFLDSIDSLFSVQFGHIQRYDARLSFADPAKQEISAEVEEWEGVNETAAILELPVVLEYGNKTFPTLVMGIPPETELYGLYSSSGRKETTREGHILLAGAIRDKLAVEAGDAIAVNSPYGKAVFELDEFVEQPMGSYGFITLGNAQQLIGAKIINGILLNMEDDSISGLRSTASQNLSGVAVGITSEIERQMMDLMDLINVIMWVMLGFGAIMALMVVFTMITISLVERRREIATMRTLGEGSGRIAGMVTIENMLLGAAGLVIGIPLGYAVTMYLMRLVQTDMFRFGLVFYGRTYLLIAGILIIVVLLSELPGILALNRLNLAKVTKEQVT